VCDAVVQRKGGPPGGEWGSPLPGGERGPTFTWRRKGAHLYLDGKGVPPLPGWERGPTWRRKGAHLYPEEKWAPPLPGGEMGPTFTWRRKGSTFTWMGKGPHLHLEEKGGPPLPGGERRPHLYQQTSPASLSGSRPMGNGWWDAWLHLAWESWARQPTSLGEGARRRVLNQESYPRLVNSAGWTQESHRACGLWPSGPDPSWSPWRAAGLLQSLAVNGLGGGGTFRGPRPPPSPPCGEPGGPGPSGSSYAGGLADPADGLGGPAGLEDIQGTVRSLLGGEDLGLTGVGDCTGPEEGRPSTLRPGPRAGGGWPVQSGVSWPRSCAAARCTRTPSRRGRPPPSDSQEG
jgi:hypothetical protein